MHKTIQQMRQQKGFTLLEILLVVAAIAILAGIVILAINPAKQLAETRNAQRQSDVNTIINAVYQYSIDNNGDIPEGIVTDAQGDCPGNDGGDSDICSDDTSCGTLVDMYDELIPTYIVDIPTDPTAASGNDSGYDIVVDDNDRITVCAPAAERDVTIEVKL